MTLKNRFLALVAATLTAFVAAPTPAHAQAFTDYAEVAITARLMRGEATPAFPTTWYVGLSTTACSDSSNGTEVTGNNYARASFTANTTNWTASNATTGVSSNATAITFNVPSGSWGTVTHWFLADAPSAGNTWVCAALTAGQTISTGNSVSFSVGSLVLTVQ